MLRHGRIARAAFAQTCPRRTEQPRIGHRRTRTRAACPRWPWGLPCCSRCCPPRPGRRPARRRCRVRARWSALSALHSRANGVPRQRLLRHPDAERQQGGSGGHGPGGECLARRRSTASTSLAPASRVSQFMITAGIRVAGVGRRDPPGLEPDGRRPQRHQHRQRRLRRLPLRRQRRDLRRHDPGQPLPRRDGRRRDPRPQLPQRPGPRQRVPGRQRGRQPQRRPSDRPWRAEPGVQRQLRPRNSDGQGFFVKDGGSTAIT